MVLPSATERAPPVLAFGTHPASLAASAALSPNVFAPRENAALHPDIPGARVRMAPAKSSSSSGRADMREALTWPLASCRFLVRNKMLPGLTGSSTGATGNESMSKASARHFGAIVVAAMFGCTILRARSGTTSSNARPLASRLKGRARARMRSSSTSASEDGCALDSSLVVTDLLAQSWLNHFNNAFLNTIERMREPHLKRVIQKLKDFADRVPPKYRTVIDKALRTDGFLAFLLARASLSLLVAKATLPSSPLGSAHADLRDEHVDLATVVEELYIAAMLHAEEQWDMELKADGKDFMAVATSFVRYLADPTPWKSANIKEALLGFDANPLVWTQYGLDVLGMSLSQSVKSLLQDQNAANASGGTGSATGSKDARKISLLGGDSLYATAQWATANLDSRECRKLIARTIAKYSDGQLWKRELLWKLDLSIREYLDIEVTGGIATFFATSCACAALVNGVDDDIATQISDFGSDVGLVVGLLKDTRSVSIRSVLSLGYMSAPVIFTLENDPKFRVLMERRFRLPGDIDEAVRRVKEGGVPDTMRLVNRLGYRAAARLECLEPTPEKQALLTFTRSMACLPLTEEGCFNAGDDLHGVQGGSSSSVSSRDARLRSPRGVLPEVHLPVCDGPGSPAVKRFQLKVENLRLRARLQRARLQERKDKEKLNFVKTALNGSLGSQPEKPPLVGMGLQFDERELDWLMLRGLERQVPVPDDLDLQSLLACVADGQKRVQDRLLALGDAARSTKLKNTIREAFDAGGKRMRPALCLLVHQTLLEGVQVASGEPRNRATLAETREKVLTLATALEVIHTASLVHDDILDDAETRRQRKAVHQIFGPDVAVLSGDFLFAHASELVESLDSDEVTRLVSLIIEQFGYGELSQSAKRFDVNTTLFEYLRKSFYKTASLLAAACRATAVLTGGLSGQVCDVMYSYGYYFGVAFQVVDDILDFSSTGEELGKPALQDLREGNLTAPVLLCLHGSEDFGLVPSPHAEELASLIRRRFGREGDFERARAIIEESDGIGMAYRLANKLSDKALEALMLVAPVDTQGRRSLAGLARWAVQRSS